MYVYKFANVIFKQENLERFNRCSLFLNQIKETIYQEIIEAYSL